MSGFIIPYIQREASSKLWSSCDFMVRRIIRIMPLYWLFTVMALAVWLVAPGLVKLGDASYSLYLIHPFVIALLAVAWYRLVPVGLGANVAFTVLCVAVSMIAYRTIERPTTHNLNGAWKAWRTRHEEVVVRPAVNIPV